MFSIKIESWEKWNALRCLKSGKGLTGGYKSLFFDFEVFFWKVEIKS